MKAYAQKHCHISLNAHFTTIILVNLVNRW